MATEIEAALQRTIIQHEDQLLAQQMRQTASVATSLLVTDLQRSVLSVLDAERRSSSLVYTPYGHRPLEGGLLSLLGFNGERPDPVTGHYLLGNGYRAFNPVLMRFNSPDSWSPFGKGGINAYGYCGGDPFNREDRTGHVWNFLKPFLRALGIISKSKKTANTVSTPLSSANSPKAIFQADGGAKLSPMEVPTQATSISRKIGTSDAAVKAKSTFTRADVITKSENLSSVDVVDKQDRLIMKYPLENRQSVHVRFTINALNEQVSNAELSDAIRLGAGLPYPQNGWRYTLKNLT
ncbi:RHS repeat-associated core domain-containing protein [Pseudomonas sp. SDO5591_S426]